MKNGLQQLFGGTAPQQAGSGTMNPMAANGAGMAPPDPGMWQQMANGINSFMPDSAANKGVQYQYPSEPGQLPQDFGQSMPQSGKKGAGGQPMDTTPVAGSVPMGGAQGGYSNGGAAALDQYMSAPTGGPGGPAISQPGGPGAANPDKLNEYGGISHKVADGGGYTDRNKPEPKAPGAATSSRLDMLELQNEALDPYTLQNDPRFKALSETEQQSLLRDAFSTRRSQDRK